MFSFTFVLSHSILLWYFKELPIIFYMSSFIMEYWLLKMPLFCWQSPSPSYSVLKNWAECSSELFWSLVVHCPSFICLFFTFLNSSFNQYYGIILALQKFVYRSDWFFSGERCGPWAFGLFSSLQSIFFFPVGIRIRIGPQYPWLVVRGD